MAGTSQPGGEKSVAGHQREAADAQSQKDDVQHGMPPVVRPATSYFGHQFSIVICLRPHKARISCVCRSAVHSRETFRSSAFSTPSRGETAMITAARQDAQRPHRAVELVRGRRKPPATKQGTRSRTFGRMILRGVSGPMPGQAAGEGRQARYVAVIGCRCAGDDAPSWASGRMAVAKPG